MEVLGGLLEGGSGGVVLGGGRGGSSGGVEAESEMREQVREMGTKAGSVEEET